jgi:spore coat protein A
MSYRKFLSVLLLLVFLGFMSTSGAWASALVPQTPVPGKSLTKYLNPLPFFAGARVDGTTPYTVTYEEFQQTGDLSLAPLYTGFLPNGEAVTGTLVWGYNVDGSGALWPGFTVAAQRGTPTVVTYENTLPLNSLLQAYLTIDQTLHWANPLGLPMNAPGRFAPYVGPPPVVAHLHGGEDASAFDGGPDQWFTPLRNPADPTSAIQGSGYKSIGGVNSNQAKYNYVNNQEPATLWFHEHVLGATRINVYAGLAAYYLLRGNGDDGSGGTNKLPDSAHEVEVVIQDRMFDTQGQLFFPDVGLNPEHPFWVPEFVGDTITVNGKVWPTLTVDPRRYRFRFLEGSNARFYNLSFERVGGKKKAVPTFWVIGTDGGFLDNPVSTPTLLYAPGERYDVIVDFTNFAGQTFLLVNNARTPFPGGAPASPADVGQIMQIVVNPTAVVDNSYNPAIDGAIRDVAGNSLPTSLPAIVRLAGYETNTQLPTGTLGTGVTPARVRQLTLNEVMGPGGPLEVLVNNTKWSGLSQPSGTVVPGSVQVGPNWLTELPQVGSTEVWEIINMTADAHPIHLHLVQFQILNRQPIRMGGSKGYVAAYNTAFGGAFLPAFGPPFNYNAQQGTKTFAQQGGGVTGSTPIIGGNPNVDPFLNGPAVPPSAYEAGWKDTAIMYPGQVTRIVVRWTPQDIAVGDENPGTNEYVGFNPTEVDATGPGTVNNAGSPGSLGYVWHCHIVDHEDNEMMRPYVPSANANNTHAEAP